MRSYRSKRKICNLNFNYKEESSSPLIEYGKVRNEYYSFRRSELKKAIVDSDIFTQNEIDIIELEGCRIVIANSLCVSPYSGFRCYLSNRFASEIIIGLKIFIAAVAADEGEVVIPINTDSSLFESLKRAVSITPNVSIRPVRDAYPLGFPSLLFDKYYNKQEERGSEYYPGKNGVLIIPVEKLLDIYISVEYEPSERCYPVFIINNSERKLIWCTSESDKLKEKLLKFKGTVIKNSLLCGKVEKNISKLNLLRSRVVFLLDNYSMVMENCIGCGICRDVCPGYKVKKPRSIRSFADNIGIVHQAEVLGCIGCGLCIYYCPGFRA